MMANTLKEVVLAVRPWSLTAAVIPVLVTAAATGSSLLSGECAKVLMMGVAVQCGANLTNTYYDFINGVDGKNTGERTLVERKLHPNTVLLLSILFFLLGTGVVFMDLVANVESTKLMLVFVLGLVLSYFYTAQPVGLKYIALGDITIFLCFGPLLMQCTSLILTGQTTREVYYLCVPIGLLTEAILHANNTRDIESDRRAGATTVASILGRKSSVLFYKMLIIGAYASVVVISAFYHFGCLLTLATLPLGLDLVKRIGSADVQTMDEDTAKVHLPFGLTLLIGILSTSSGFLSFLF